MCVGLPQRFAQRVAFFAPLWQLDHMKHLQSFKYVRAIAASGSIRKAAETLAISPSALNRHIQTLELDLDIQIFERVTKGVRLTSEGELFLNFAMNQLSGFNRVRQQIANMKGLRVGELRVGISEDFDQSILHDMIAKFQRDHSQIDVTIERLTSQDELYRALDTQSIELALYVNPVLRKGIQILHGADVDIAAFVPLGLGLGKNDELRIFEFQGIRLALPPAHTEVTKRIEAAIDKNRIDTLIHYRGPDMSRFLEHAFSAVIGISVVVNPGPAPIQISGYKRTSLLRREIGTCNFCLVGSDDHGLSFAAHAFQEIFSEAFQ